MALNINTSNRKNSSPLNAASKLLASLFNFELLRNGDDTPTGLIDAINNCESMALVLYRGRPYLVIEGSAVNYLIHLGSPELAAFIQRVIKLATGKVKPSKAVSAAIEALISEALIEGVEVIGSEFNANLDVDGSTGVVLSTNDPKGDAILLHEGVVSTIKEPTGLTFDFKPKNGKLELVDQELTPDQHKDFRNLFSNLIMEQFNLLMAWVTFIMAHPSTEGLTNPIGYIHGGAGTGKTTIVRLIAKLLGMREAIVKTLPKSVRDLVATASNDHLMAFDNVSNIKDVMSDAFCSVSTGGTVGDRTLYTNTGITETKLHQPMVITAIELAKQQDLMSRCVFFSVKKPTISYQNENAMYQILDSMLPQVQTWLLKTSAKALTYVDSVEPVVKHRASTFCVWLAAYEKALGITDQSVQKHFGQSFKETLKLQAITHDPVLSSIVNSITELKHISGTPTNIHRALTNHIEASEGRLPRKWPANANPLSIYLGKAEEQLAKHNILLDKDLKRDHKGAKQWILKLMPENEVKHVEEAIKTTATPDTSVGNAVDSTEEEVEKVVVTMTTEPEVTPTNPEDNTEDANVDGVIDTPEYVMELDEDALLEMQKEQDLEYELALDLEIDDGVRTNISVEDIDPELAAMLEDT